ncbi:MAG: hypothetical protein ACTS27_05130, partial [Phycisphaerales bacterium]
MAKKRRGPTLLELIREPPPGGAFRMGSSAGSSGGSSNGEPSGQAYTPARSAGGGSGGLSWWQMGARTVRIPIGYVIVAGGVALALAVVQFVVVAALAGLATLLFESPTAAGIWAGRVSIGYSGVLLIGVAFTLQILAQGT